MEAWALTTYIIIALSAAAKLLIVATSEFPLTQPRTIGWYIADIVFGLGFVLWGTVVLF